MLTMPKTLSCLLLILIVQESITQYDYVVADTPQSPPQFPPQLTNVVPVQGPIEQKLSEVNIPPQKPIEENTPEDSIEQLNETIQSIETDTDIGIDHEETHTEEEHHYLHPGESKFWKMCLLAAFLTCVGAFCSGLAVGMLSIEPIQLEIMSMSDDPQEKEIGQTVLSLVSNHHLFLVTLLIANAIALESLPIVIHMLMPAWAAILFSTFVVLIAAEIIPQAFCTGPKKIYIGYRASPIIKVMMKLFWIIAYPMAKGLDYLLGEHNHQRIQHKDFANFLTGGSQTMKNSEKLLLTSILQLRTKRVPEVMISLKDLYMLSLTDRLTSAKIKQMNEKDYSFILIYKQNRSNVVGVIKMKEFAAKFLKSQKKNQIVEDYLEDKQDILSVYEDTNLLQMMMLFQTRNARYSLVIGKKKKIEPGVQSIMYSKSDMVANNQEGEILGVVFLYKLFEEITEHNEQVAQVLHMDSHGSHRNIEMSEIQRPLLQH